MESPSEEGQARPMPCPECGSTRGYSRVGDFRVQCLGCNSLLKNREVDMEITNEEDR
jgi:transcription initiation factor TFIIIB Brf1 subunit/transcription initiation factor TFIIB